MDGSKPRFVLALLALAASGCDPLGLGPDEGRIGSLFITAVGDTLHGLNRSYQFEVVALDDDGQRQKIPDVVWSTSDPEIATVDQSGSVITRSVGTVQIAAAVRDTSVEAEILVDDRAATIAGGLTFTCALDQTGAAYCWGVSSRGNLGNGTGQGSITPVRVAGDLQFHSLSAGWAHHVCGLTTGGEAYCLGGNTHGQLGDGTQGINRPTPVPVEGDIKFKYLRTARSHTCGIGFDDQAYCWGVNSRGQIGAEVAESCPGVLHSEPCTTVPVRVETDLTFKSIQLGPTYTCGIDMEGMLRCWGDTELPDLPRASRAAAVGTYRSVGMTGAGTDVTFQYARGANWWQCGMGTDDQVYCWGETLGDSTGARSLTPVLVPDQPAFVFLGEANRGHICGLDADGIAYCWGDSITGGLGLGPETWRTPIPLMVDPELRFYSIGSGDQHTCAITLSFDMYCWGADSAGELGDGTLEGDPDCLVDFPCRMRPVRVLFRSPEHGLIEFVLSSQAWVIFDKELSPVQGKNLRLAAPAPPDLAVCPQTFHKHRRRPGLCLGSSVGFLEDRVGG